MHTLRLDETLAPALGPRHTSDQKIILERAACVSHPSSVTRLQNGHVHHSMIYCARVEQLLAQQLRVIRDLPAN